MPRHRRPDAFTLIELLVVIAIIAVLIAVLLPALGQAREQGRQLSCASRMRQVATAWAVYADENQDVAVPVQPGRYDDEQRNIYFVGNGYQYRPRWYALLGTIEGLHAFASPSPNREDEHTLQIAAKVFLCPSVPHWTNARNYPYGYNYQFLGNARFRNNDQQAGFINFPVRASTIYATKTVMAADSLGTAAGKPLFERTEYLPDGSRHPERTAVGGHGYALDPPRLTDNCDYADRRSRAPEHRSAPDTRHLGKANVSFCDGHIETLSLRELGYATSNDGRIAPWGKDTTNALFSGDLTDKDPPELFE